MPTYLLAHRHPTDYTGTADTPAAWNAWFVALGSNLVDLGNPVFDRSPIGNCGPDSELGGYTIITANNINTAVSLARACPLLNDGGGIEIGVLTPVPGRQHPARDF